MAKKGALKSTLIVTSDELKVNGGRWLLQSGPAIRVRGFNSDSIGDRKIIGGDALPIYVLAESDARVNGGQFLLKGGQPIQITDVIGSARGVIQGKAIPVWPVDDDGNYDADFAGAVTYSEKVLATQIGNMIGYWQMDEAAGPASIDSSPEGNDGVFAGGVTFGQPGIGDGKTSVLLDGINGLNNIYSAAFAADFNQQEGTMMLWCKVLNAGIWPAGGDHRAFAIGADLTLNFSIFGIQGANNFRYEYIAAATNKNVVRAGESTTDWFHAAVTWSLSAGVNGEYNAYFDGVQEGVTQTALGTWVAALAANLACIGAQRSDGLRPWSGNVAHGVVWDIPLTGAEVANLAVV